MLVLACGVAKHIPADRIDVSIGVEKANDLVWLLKRLDGRVEKHPIEAMLSIPRTSLKSDLGTTGNLWHAFIFGAVMLFVKRRSDHVSWGGE